MKELINSFQNQQIADIKTHIERINFELGQTQKCISGIKKDVWWLKRLLFIGLPLIVSLLLILLSKQ